ncbi:MAG: HAD family hydrolase [Acidobacteriia bacterium]|nr:HAD family hydrolase [Methyloceanibacter sp.]MCL6490816.1 HAD family hydrolase [Terriglobia bacterium]
MSRPALFLDRDGIVNYDLGYVHRPEDVIFCEGIFELCQAATARGMALVIVTNQAGIGRGLYTEAEFYALMHWMLNIFAAHGIRFTGVEFCPDHPEHGIGPYRRETPRRKPGPGMILDACAAHGLDPALSAMLGDRASDMQAAEAAGIPKRVLLPITPLEAEAAPRGTIIVREGGLHAVRNILFGESASPKRTAFARGMSLTSPAAEP